MEANGQLHDLAALIPGNDPDIHWIEGWLGLRAGPVSVEKTKKKIPFLLLPQISHICRIY
jgi:hypothetical protein